MKISHLCIALVGLLALAAVIALASSAGIATHAAAVDGHFPVMAMMMAPLSRSALLQSTALRRHPGTVAVRAEAKEPTNGEIKALLEDVQKTFNAFKASNDDRIKAVEKKQDDVVTNEKVDRISNELGEMSQRIAALNLTGGNGQQAAPSADQRAYGTAFNGYFRKGAEAGLRELEVKAAANEGSNPDGGYTVPVQVETTIDRVLANVSAMRRISRVITISGAVYRKPISKGGATSGWVGEQSARPQTANPQLAALDFPAMELYAMPAATQTLLDDSNIDIAQWLSDEVTITFAEQEGIAFVNGDGQAQPLGLLTVPTVVDGNWAWGKLGYTSMGSGGALKTDGTGYDDVIDLMTAPKQGYRVNSNFLMNRKSEAAMRKLKDPEGHYLWQPALQAGALASLGGYPVAIDDNMPDIGANKFPIAFGDFSRGYLIVDRIGIRVLRDPFSSKPYVLFYTTKRVGGGVQNFEAIKLAKIAA